ncbi:uncharacterized protein [Oryza sativa Japonica Group]|nr:uncharacterized protein LOC4342705 [Oryza sativa Japonica Group]XP_015645726.1 uncharacterized protein LOC4342705 [Oryza sativa Japonica Group]XP_015645727.1 uncharacterized protein LOC4342705 [Oryza sativa Japonica Group]KAF2921921.1 hypothetical protein DAI22_07g071000 [Oryza sativa Japonica Group]KAF2921922.1 hypothetical protein DAI22_07g071000 [Oryza sativa Japonica Group]KAF2921923.1 hypothetical protein DAI22_07g071000 [Oryza sativa Japonica Group]
MSSEIIMSSKRLCRESDDEDERHCSSSTNTKKRACRESEEEDERHCSSNSSTKKKSLKLGLVPFSSHNHNHKQRHLYLVLDDWEAGYSIHKVVDDDFGARPAAAAAKHNPLIRIQAQHAYSRFFAAHGTKIIAMHPASFSPGIPVFDTRTLEMAVYPPPKSRSIICPPVYASVGDRLVTFVHQYLEVLGPHPPRSAAVDDDDEPEPPPWSWTTVEPLPQFHSGLVTGYALHPDGRTIFISIEDCVTFGTRKSTFSFDAGRLEWTRVGDWMLPFEGQAHYDRELDAWVGICRYGEGTGHLCCCDVPPSPAADAACTTTLPAWKFCKEVMFKKGFTGYWGATLVYMGDSRFCLVDCRVPDDCDVRTTLRVLTITSFGLKYDKAGELVTTRYRAYASISYQIAGKFKRLEDPIAFWM